MSLRKQAKILGISPTYLSLLLNEKRPWLGNLKERYEERVNTVVNTPEANAAISNGPNGNLYVKSGAEGGIRTHKPVRAADFKSAASAIPPPRRSASAVGKHSLPARSIIPTIAGADANQWQQVCRSLYLASPGVINHGCVSSFPWDRARWYNLVPPHVNLYLCTTIDMGENLTKAAL